MTLEKKLRLKRQKLKAYLAYYDTISELCPKELRHKQFVLAELRRLDGEACRDKEDQKDI